MTGFTCHAVGKSFDISVWDITNSDFCLEKDKSSILTLHEQFPAQNNNYLHTRLNQIIFLGFSIILLKPT